MAQAVYDPESEEKPIPHSLNDITGISPEDERAMEDAAYDGAADDIAERENLFNPDGDSPSGSTDTKSREDLKSDEEKGESKREAKRKEQEQKRTQKREDKFNKRVHSGSSFKKKMAIAGAAAGGSALVGIIAFFALLPLKIESLISDLDSHFTSASSSAIDNEVDNLYSSYVTKEVLPNFLHKKDCRSSVDASCVSVPSGTGPVTRLYKAWSQGRLEEKLATQSNIMIGKKNGQLFMNIGGSTLNDKDIKQIAAGESMFNLSGTTQASRSEIRAKFKEGFQDATLYDKVFTRFKLGKLLEEKYGIQRCVIACNIRDKFTDSVADKKLAAKGYIVQRVVGPLSDNYSIIIQCLIGGGNTCDNASSDGSTTDENDPDQEKTSKFQANLQNQLSTYREGDKEALSKLVSDYKSINKDGWTKYLIAKIMTKLLNKEVTSETISSLTSPSSWLQDVAKIVNLVNDAGKLKALGYAANAAAAVGLYTTFSTVVNEVHSGHMDPTELGSFTSELDNDGVDASATPLYSNLIGSQSSDSTAASFFSAASADSLDTPNSAGTYTCNNGKKIPSGDMVCPEEDLSRGNATASAISKYAHSLPGWGALSSASTVANTISNSDWDPASWASKLGNLVVEYTPGVSSLTGFFSGYLSDLINPLFKTMINDLVPSPFSTDMSGGRNFDMIAAGDDVAQNKSCEVQLGCHELTPQQAQAINNNAVQQQKVAFDSESMFARMFDTDSSYSLINHLALDLPDNFLSATNNFFGSLLSNPFGKLATAFGSLFSVSHAFAISANPQNDPFGVTQYGYTQADLDQLDSAVSADGGYDNYMQENCDGTQTTNWVNNQQLDPNTGDAVATTSNPCLLINSAIQSSGGFYDPSLLPPGSTNGGD